MSDNEYNGWTNYPTWRVNLELISDCADQLIQERDQSDSVSQLADYFENYADECITNFGELEGIAVDYARAFLSDVNWHEIAEHYEDELVRADDEDEEDA